jgi:signal transduction histidine kinase
MNDANMRPTGLSAVGALAWGSHFCQFFDTDQDFLDVLIPYLRTGIAEGELCLWIYSPPFDEVSAEGVLRGVRVIACHDFFCRDGRFDADHAARQWERFYQEALAEGFQGLRVLGHHTTFTRQHWGEFVEFERSLDAELHGKKAIALCAYSLSEGRATEVLEVADVHQLAVARRHGRWQVLENQELANKKAELQALVESRTRQLTQANDELRRLGARLHSAREEEGARIARELHDELGSALTSLKWELDRLAPEGEQAGALASMHALVDTTLASVRRIATELRPAILDDLGLLATIEWQAQQFAQHSGIECRVHRLLEEVPLTNGQSTAVFRILQEALTNVLRHAGATVVDITVSHGDAAFVLEVKDNGRGISRNAVNAPGTLGLLGMRERASLAGGTLELSGEPGRGTVLTVRIATQ